MCFLCSHLLSSVRGCARVRRAFIFNVTAFQFPKIPMLLPPTVPIVGLVHSDSCIVFVVRDKAAKCCGRLSAPCDAHAYARRRTQTTQRTEIADDCGSSHESVEKIQLVAWNTEFTTVSALVCCSKIAERDREFRFVVIPQIDKRRPCQWFFCSGFSTCLSVLGLSLSLSSATSAETGVFTFFFFLGVQDHHTKVRSSV